MSSTLFPHFRQRLINESVWAKETAAVEQPPHTLASKEPVVKMASKPAFKGFGGGFAKPLMLDLDALQPARDDASMDADKMLQQKRDKLAAFDRQCSKVAEGLYVSGKTVAENWELLADNHITHVVNCVGALYPEYFKSKGVVYKTLWLQDVPQEDILCILYDTFDFIEAARKGDIAGTMCSSTGGTPFSNQQQQQQASQQLAAASCNSQGEGRVLVHCSQGVSRSTTIAIAYLMWKTGGSYEEVYQMVRALRGVTSPNIGFMCQLMNWAKRRQKPPSRARVYRIAPHCPDDPTYLVPKAVSPQPGCSYPDWSTLDPRGCFVVHLPEKLYVWMGSTCLSDMAEAGMRAARGLMRYEGAPVAELVRQGEEPHDLIAALSTSCNPRPSSAMMSVEPSSNNLPAAAAAAGGSEDEEMQPVATPGPNQQQRRQPPPWGSPQHSARPSSSNSRPTSALQNQQQQQQQRQCDLSNALSDATQLSVQLSSQQLGGNSQGLVSEVAEYNGDYELWLRAVLKIGGTSSTEAGRLTPRSSLASLVVDDLNASSSGRAESPATVEGRNRKYRRSESESLRILPSFRQPGRLSTSSNPSLWPIGSPSAAAVSPAAASIYGACQSPYAPSPSAVAEATGGFVSPISPDRRVYSEPVPAATAAAAAAEAGTGVGSVTDGDAGGFEAAQGHIKRMSIDENH